MLHMRQADLARQVGISASYLNLIEHNRRRIGGKLLAEIAQALDVDLALLTEGADRGLSDRLLQIGRAEALPEAALAQAEAVIARAPDWAALLVRLADRVQSLEQTVEGLNNRLTHDPTLAAAMHEVLSMVTAVRSTASILATTPEIDANWIGRFHKNLDEDSRRLARGAEAVVAYFDAQSRQETTFSTALEAQATVWDAHGHHFAQIEAEGAAAIDAVLAQTSEAVQGIAPVLRRRFAIYAEDAAALPLAPFLAAARAEGFQPERLVARFDQPADRVLRRLACLPPDSGAPEMGMVVCDAAGAILHRKAMVGLNLPFLGAACPLLPLFEGFSRPGQPLRRLIEMPDGSCFHAWSVAAPLGQMGFSDPTPLIGTMLLMRAPEAQADAAHSRPVGPNCRVCPRRGCATRREPSMIAPVQAARPAHQVL